MLTEVIDQYSEKLLTDKAQIERLAKTDKTIAQRILDWIRDKIAILQGKTKEERETIAFLRKAEKLYIDALNATASGSNEMKFSIKKMIKIKMEDNSLTSTKSELSELPSTNISIRNTNLNVNTKSKKDIKFSLAETAGAKESEKTEAKRLWKELGTDSPYFKKWFGNSKIVDDAGKPKIFYHGSNSEELIKSFDTGKSNYGGLFFFTSDPTFALGWSRGEVADKFSWTGEGELLYDGENITDYEEKVLQTTRPRSRAHGGNVYPVYLKVEKPFDYFESDAQKQSLYDYLISKDFSESEAEALISLSAK